MSVHLVSSGHGKSARAGITGGQRRGDREGSHAGHCGCSQLSIEKDFGFYNGENGGSLAGLDLCFIGITQEVGLSISFRG